MGYMPPDADANIFEFLTTASSFLSDVNHNCKSVAKFNLNIAFILLINS
jgi:hypothetical protein